MAGHRCVPDMRTLHMDPPQVAGNDARNATLMAVCVDPDCRGELDVYLGLTEGDEALTGEWHDPHEGEEPAWYAALERGHAQDR